MAVTTHSFTVVTTEGAELTISVDAGTKPAAEKRARELVESLGGEVASITRRETGDSATD